MLCALRSALCALRFALCALRFALCALRSALCALRFVLCALRSALCTLRSALCALRFALCALRSVLCALRFVLCALRFDLCAIMLSAYTPVPVVRFGSLVTLWPPEKLPNGVSSGCRNVRFTPSSVISREGLSLAISTGVNSPITGLAGLVPQPVGDGQSAASMPLLFDAAGNLWQESPAGSAVLQRLASSAVALPSRSFMQSALAYNRAWLAFGDGRVGAIPPASADGVHLDPVALPAPAGSAAAADAASAGNVAAGFRYGIVLYQTRSGYMTAPQSPFSWNAAGGKQVAVTNLPIGPEQVTARIVAFTVAGGSNAGPYFAIGESQSIQGVQETSTWVGDNTSTSAVFNFDDTFLAASTDCTAAFRKIQPPAEAAVMYSPSTRRLLYWGESSAPSLVRISQPDDPETFYGDTGFALIAENDGQRITACFEFKGQIFVAKQNSLYLLIPTTGAPATWDVRIANDRVGVSGPRAFDVAADFVAFAHPSGCYVFDGGDPVLVSLEVDDLWRRINWDYAHLIWVHIDPASRELRIGAPLDASTVPNVVFKVNYQEDWKAPVVFSPFTGDERAYPGRKWSLDDISAFSALRIVRPLWPGSAALGGGIPASLALQGVPGALSKSQLLFASANPDGAVCFLDPAAHTDNGIPFASWYQTAPLSPTAAQLGASIGVQSIAAVTLTARGRGVLQVELLPDSAAIDAAYENLSPLAVAGGGAARARRLRPVVLRPEANADFRLGAHLQADRIALRVSASAEPGAWFELSAACAWMRTAWRAPTGNN